jgi:fructokinase
VHTLVVGEALVDVVRDETTVVEHPGGSAANAAVALARLGRPTRLLTAYADDDRGALLDRHLADAGVLPAVDPHLLRRTPTATATLGPDGAATYEFDLEWRLAELGGLTDARFVHVCSLAGVLEPGASRVLDLLAEASAPVTYDVNARPAVTGTGASVTAAIERVAAMATLVKASDEDLAVLYPSLTAIDAVARLRALGPQVVVVTRGADGADWFGADTVHVPAVPVRVADTIGAGDTFGAALLDALWDLDPTSIAAAQVEDALSYAVRAAAITVSRPGADPPTRAELVAAPR